MTNASTGTFAVDDVRAIQIGAEITFNTTTYTVTRVDTESNLVTVTPEILDFPRPFAVGDTLTFNNPFTSTTTASKKFLHQSLATHGCCDHAEPNWAQACQASPSSISRQMVYSH